MVENYILVADRLTIEEHLAIEIKRI